MIFKLILFYIILEYLRPGDIFPPLKILQLNSFVLPMFIFLASLLRSKTSLKNYFLSNFQSKFILLLLLLHGLSLMASMFSPHMNAGEIFKSTRALIGYVLTFFFLSNETKGTDKLEKVIRALVFVFAFVVVININKLSSASHRDYLQSGSFLSDGNDFALALNVILPLTLFLFFNETSPLKKLTFAVCSCLFLAAIVLTVSRGGMIGLASSMLYFLFIGKRKVAKFVMVGLVIVLILNFAPESFLNRMESIKSYKTESTSEKRMLAWKAATQMAMDYPLTGIGPGNFRNIYALEYKPEKYNVGAIYNAAHSTYFQTLADLGFPGIFTVLGIVFSSIVSNLKAMKKPLLYPREKEFLNYLTMSWIGFAVSAAFLSALYYPHIFVLGALSAAARNNSLKEKEVSNHKRSEINEN